MRLASRICDAIALTLVAFVAGVLAWHARYAPELGYDESAAWLGVRLFRDFSFGNDIDPAGMFQFQRAVFMDVYPPVYPTADGRLFLFTLACAGSAYFFSHSSRLNCLGTST
jgi:hypothetical protein